MQKTFTASDRARFLCRASLGIGLLVSSLSWPANAGDPGDIFSILSNQIVIARLVRATHGRKLDRRHVLPWVARIKRAMTVFGLERGCRAHLGGPHSRAMTVMR
jgi:hypothetical protein